MRSIFIGFLLIFLDFNFNIGESTIGLIPDFIGYILLVQGLREMEPESARFPQARPFAVGTGIYSAITYALDLFGVTNQLGGLGIALGFLYTIVSLCLAWLVVKGVQEAEQRRRTDLNGHSLWTAWLLMAVFQLISYVFLFIPVLVLVGILASFVISIVFLVALHTAKNRYAELPPLPAAECREPEREEE